MIRIRRLSYVFFFFFFHGGFSVLSMEREKKSDLLKIVEYIQGRSFKADKQKKKGWGSEKVLLAV